MLPWYAYILARMTINFGNHCCDVSIELIIISIYHILYFEFWLSFPLNFSFCLWVKREEVGCSGMWKISLFYLNRILNFNSESITRIIVCCMKFRKIEKSPNLWCSRQSSDHRLGWGWKPGIICLLGRDVLLVSVARAAGCSTGDPLRSPYPQQESFNAKEFLSLSYPLSKKGLRKLLDSLP